MSTFETCKKTGGVYLKKVIDPEKELFIPSSIDGQTVIGIHDRAFKGLTTVQKIVLPDTVEYIGDGAFQNCSKLTDLIIPKDIAYLGKGCFKGCKKLTKVFIDSDRWEFRREIVDDVFTTFWLCVKRRSTREHPWLESAFRGTISFGDSPKDHVITGFDPHYDSDCHDLKKTKDGIFYFINEEGRLVIGHGGKPYSFPDKDIVIPDVIDGKPVYAIGTEAFKGAQFRSMILPASVQIVSAHAFYGAQFDYAELPKKLHYLNNVVFGGDFLEGIFDSVTNTESAASYLGVVLMPDEIEVTDYRSLTQPARTIFVGRKECPDVSYVTGASVGGEFRYDPQTRMFYLLRDDGGAVLIQTSGPVDAELPSSVNGVTVTGWDARLLKDRTRKRVSIDPSMLKITKDDGEVVSVETQEGFVKREALCRRTEIPERITEITSIFGDTFTYDGKNVVFPKGLKSLAGLESGDDYVVVPKGLSQISKCNGLFLIEEGNPVDCSSLRDCYSVQVVDHVVTVEKGKDYDYIVQKCGGRDVAFLLSVNGEGDRLTIPETVDGLPVVGCRIKPDDSATFKILSIVNSHLGDEDFTKAFRIDYYAFEEAEFGGVETLGPRFRNLLNELLIGDKKKGITVLEGVEEIADSDMGTWITFGSSAEPVNTLRLPTSLKRVGHNAFKCLDLCRIEVFKDTFIEADIVEEGCKIIRYDGDTMTEEALPEPSFNYDEDPAPSGGVDLNSEILRRAAWYDTSGVNPSMLAKAKQIVAEGKIEVQDIFDDEILATCRGSAGEEYSVRLYINGYGRFSSSCDCPSFINGLNYNNPHANVKCKHIYALILLLKEEYQWQVEAPAYGAEGSSPGSGDGKPFTIGQVRAQSASTVPTRPVTPPAPPATGLWKAMLIVSFVAGVLAALGFIMLLCTKGTFTFYIMNQGEVVSRPGTVERKLMTYFGGFMVFLFAMHAVGSLIMPFGCARKKQVAFGFSGAVLLDLIILIVFIVSSVSMSQDVPKSSTPSFPYKIEGYSINGCFGFGVFCIVVALLCHIVSLVFGIVENVSKKR